MPDTCSATRRERGRLLICELPLHHDGDHRDGEHTWPQEDRPEQRVVIQ